MFCQFFNCFFFLKGFLLKVTCASDINTTSVFESLYHHNPHIRTEAVSYLVQNIEKLSLASENHELLKLSISERINDDNPNVVAEVLKINSSILVDVLGDSELIAKMSKILLKYWNKPERWNDVCLLALNLITSKRQMCDQNFLLIVLLPFLFPKNDAEVKLAQVIVNSEFGKGLKLSGVREKNATKLSNDMNGFLMGSGVFSTQSILEIIKSILIDHQGTGSVAAHFVIYALAFSLKEEQTSSLSLEIFSCIKEVLKSSKLCGKSLTDNSTIKNHEVPIAILEILFQNLLKSTKFTDAKAKINFKSQSDESIFKFTIFEYLVEGFFTTSSENRGAINKIIKTYLNFLCCDNQASKIQFLAQFCVIHAVNCENIELQVRTMQLLSKALSNFSTINQKGAKVRFFLNNYYFTLQSHIIKLFFFKS